MYNNRFIVLFYQNFCILLKFILNIVFLFYYSRLENKPTEVYYIYLLKLTGMKYYSICFDLLF